MIRGSCTDVTWPKREEFTFVLTPRKEGWLKALKNSARNCVLTRSVILVFLIAARSQLLNPGPYTTPRPEVPKCPLATAQAPLLNHSWAVFGPLTVCETRSGRGETADGSIPIPSGKVCPAMTPWRMELNGSKFCVMVRGTPDSNVVIPESSQPPAT